MPDMGIGEIAALIGSFFAEEGAGAAAGEAAGAGIGAEAGAAGGAAAAGEIGAGGAAGEAVGAGIGGAGAAAATEGAGAAAGSSIADLLASSVGESGIAGSAITPEMTAAPVSVMDSASPYALTGSGQGAQAAVGTGEATGSSMLPLGAGSTSSAEQLAALSQEESAAMGYPGSTSPVGDMTNAMKGAGLNPATGEASGGILGSLTSPGTLAKLGIGGGFNLGSQILKSQQQKSNLADYLSNATWTPGKAQAYMNATNRNTAGTIGQEAMRSKGSLAEQMAGAGRGGGEYGNTANAITENALNQMAQGRNQALTTVSAPSQLSPAPFMQGSNPWAETMYGMGGMMGNMATSSMTQQLLKQLGLWT